MDNPDLFGESVVTWPEVHAWVHAMAPHMERTERSLRQYIRQWEVVRKVASAKDRGDFQALIEARI
ncbi:MAG: hypothetical protein ACYCSN_18315 [Acidobacteriaceae bacterium]